MLMAEGPRIPVISWAWDLKEQRAKRKRFKALAKQKGAKLFDESMFRYFYSNVLGEKVSQYAREVNQLHPERKLGYYDQVWIGYDERGDETSHSRRQLRKILKLEELGVKYYEETLPIETFLSVSRSGMQTILEATGVDTEGAVGMSNYFAVESSLELDQETIYSRMVEIGIATMEEGKLMPTPLGKAIVSNIRLAYQEQREQA